MPPQVKTRLTLAALLGCAGLAGYLATVSVADTASAPPCAPRASTLDGRRAIAYCGPATVVIEIGGRRYRFSHGLCDLSKTAGGLELSVGTLVKGSAGNAGKPFAGLMIARSPSESEAFEADTGGHLLFGDTVVAPTGNLFAKGTFNSLYGVAFSGSWDCHGVVYSGP